MDFESQIRHFLTFLYPRLENSTTRITIMWSKHDPNHKKYTTKINSVPWSSKFEDTLFRIFMQSTIPLVSTFSPFDSIQSDLISVFPVTRPLRFVHRELGLGHYGEILTRTFRILHLQRLHAKAIYPTSTIYYVILAHTKGWVLFVPFSISV